MKQPSEFSEWFKLLFAASIAVLGAWWTLSSALAHRPTLNQVHSIVERHERRPHTDAEKRLHNIAERLSHIESDVAFIKRIVNQRGRQ